MKEEILQRVDVLAAKLGIAAQFIFSLYVKQAKIEAVQDIMLFIGGLILAYISHRLFIMVNKLDYDGNDGWVFLMFGTGIIAFFLIIIPPFYVPTELLNPEYWAFKELLSQLNPAK